MKTTRTQFVLTLATGLAAVSLRPDGLLAFEAPPLPTADFRPLVGHTFRFDPADGRSAVDLVLLAVEDRPPSRGTRQFSLTLAAPEGELLREGAYGVEEDRLGAFRMYVVPIGRDAKGQALYRADFNLLLTTTGAPAPARRR